ncbi:MAG: hypothetical protein ACP5SI_10815 [Chloroflexia bacterium]
MAVAVELYTVDHIIRGLIDTAGDRLTDVLNVKTESALVLREAEVVRHLSLGKVPPLRLPVVRVEKEQILFAIPVAERDITHKSLYRRTSRLVFEIVVLLPNFELRGSIHLTERLDVRRVLVVRPEEYIPLTDAAATFVLYPQLVVRAGTIIFNKRHVAAVGEPAGAEAGPAGTPSPPSRAG